MWGLLALLCLSACGPAGEPMSGDIAVHWGNDSPKMVVGTAVQDQNAPANMLVQLGSDNVDCGTYLDELILIGGPTGTFVYFSVDKTTPAAVPSVFVSVEQATSHSSDSFSSAGTVTIDSIGDRVKGSVTFTTTDDMIGTISAMGSFDVK